MTKKPAPAQPGLFDGAAPSAPAPPAPPPSDDAARAAMRAKLRAMVLELGDLDANTAATIEALTARIVDTIAPLPMPARVAALNLARVGLQAASPFVTEPVDCVLWVCDGVVEGNEWNPNHVPSVEFLALVHSVEKYGYTMPIVGSWVGAGRVSINDGFHRHLVPKRSPEVRGRIHGFLPLSFLPADMPEADRMSATMLHNEARGTHNIEKELHLVASLGVAGWSSQEIMLGTVKSSEELVRMRQIDGAAANLRSVQLGKAWTFDKPAPPKKAKKPRAKKKGGAS